MASYEPGAWSRIARAAELETANREALNECGKDAARTGKPQRCTVQVGPFTRPSPVPGVSETRERGR
jgi:hypothetical protein